MRLSVIVTFLNQSAWFMNATLPITTFLNHVLWFKNVAITNSRILISFLTLTLKRATYAFHTFFFFFPVMFLLFIFNLFFIFFALSLLSRATVSSQVVFILLVHLFFCIVCFSYSFFALVEVLLHCLRASWVCFLCSIAAIAGPVPLFTNVAFTHNDVSWF